MKLDIAVGLLSRNNSKDGRFISLVISDVYQ